MSDTSLQSLNVEMTALNVEHVETLTEEQVEAATEMCDRCYYGDISIKALIGGNWDIQADYWRSLIRAGLLEGRVYVVKDQKYQIVSIGVWFEAGNDLFQTFVYHTMANVSKKGWTKEDKAHRWWCANLATDPEYQGRGCATRIVQQALKDAEENGCTLGLATGPELNVQKYLAMGFRKRSEEQHDGAVRGANNDKFRNFPLVPPDYRDSICIELCASYPIRSLEFFKLVGAG
ncbi:hypothetical protein F5876DRAFT_63263 [Lentinula aff. lateritia]|uniref:Uncharacterized protein n=1 Tax=Lentinula aff. lateritia TaxID=2804960 RepID=A0ACC1U950_9AGAR|nr:hypothetical protein F5876DRAFT_63263 [Lentinula aff. lateritia]